MPKIFLIKNRLHQQQLRLDSQNLLGTKDEHQDRLGALGGSSQQYNNRRSSFTLQDSANSTTGAAASSEHNGSAEDHQHTSAQHRASGDEPLSLVARKRDISRNLSDESFGK